MAAYHHDHHHHHHNGNQQRVDHRALRELKVKQNKHVLSTYNKAYAFFPKVGLCVGGGWLAGWWVAATPAPAHGLRYFPCGAAQYSCVLPMPAVQPPFLQSTRWRVPNSYRQSGA